MKSILSLLILIYSSMSFAQISLEWESPIKSTSVEMGWATWLLMKPPYEYSYRFYINDKNKIQFMFEGAYNLNVEYEYTFSQEEKNAGSYLMCSYYDLNNDGFPEFLVNKSYQGSPNRRGFRFFDLKTNTTYLDFDEANYSYHSYQISDIDKDGTIELVVRKENYPSDGNYQIVSYNLNIPVSSNSESEVDPIESFVINQNFPNPFNPGTNIRVLIPDGTEFKIIISDIQGKIIKTLVDSYLESGTYEFIWDGKNEIGEMVATGVYFYTSFYNNQADSKKMLLLK